MNKTSRPQLSICIPVFNGERFIGSTISSVLAQPYTDFEIVVVDNSSSDNTVLIVNSFEDQRIRLIQQERTLPAWKNWSTAVSNARGVWTKLVCADDLLTPNSLELFNEIISTYPHHKVIVGSRNIIDENGNQVLSVKKNKLQNKSINQSEFLRAIIKSGSNPIGESVCIAWRSELTEIVGNFSDKWNYFIDLDYWIRLSGHSPLLVTDCHIGSFRISSGSWTSRIGLASIKEAREFFNTNAFRREFTSLELLIAVLKAFMKAIARQAFILTAPKLNNLKRFWN